jgi:hypothetical protein
MPITTGMFISDARMAIPQRENKPNKTSMRRHLASTAAMSIIGNTKRAEPTSSRFNAFQPAFRDQRPATFKENVGQ